MENYIENYEPTYSREVYKPSLMGISDYIFSCSYPISFMGAYFYSTLCLINIDPSVIIVNRNMTVLLAFLIGISGIISLFAYLRIPGNIPVIGAKLLPNGNSTIKTNIDSYSTY